MKAHTRQAAWFCAGLALSLLLGGCGGEKKPDLSNPRVAEAMPWIEQLKRGDPPKRAEAIAALAKIDHECVIEPLEYAATYDNQVELRAKAIRALARPSLIKDPQPLIDLLSSPEGEVRLAACEALTILKPASAEDALAGHISDPVTSVRLAAVKALSQLGSKGLARLDKTFAEGSVEERAAIIDVYGLSGEKARVPALIQALGADEDALRRAASEALGRLKDDSAVPALLKLPYQPLSDARIKASEERIARGATNADADAIVRMLDAERVRNGDTPGGARAHSHLFKEGKPEKGVDKQGAAANFRQMVEQQLRNSAQVVRIAAVDALRQIGSPAAVDGIVELLAVSRDKFLEKLPTTQRSAYQQKLADQQADDLAAAALKALSDSDLGKEQLYNVLADAKRPAAARVRALSVLVKENRTLHESRGDTLMTALDKLKKGEKVGYAIRRKWEKPPPDVSPLHDRLQAALVANLADPDPVLRVQCAKVLASRKVDKALEPLLALLDNPNPEIRLAVIEGLANFKDPRPVPKLVAMLRGASGSELEVPIIDALGAIGDKSAVPDLVKMLSVDHPQAIAIVKALGKIGDASAGVPLMNLHREVSTAATRPVRTGDDPRRLSGLRSATIASLGQVKCTAALPMLISLMEVESKKAGDAEVLDALGDVGDKSAVPAIVARLQRPPYRVKTGFNANFTTKAGIRALSLLNDPRAVPLLASWTRCPPAPDSFTIEYAFDALGAIKCNESAEALLKLLVDPNVDAAVKDSNVGPALVQLGEVPKPQLMKLMIETPPTKDVEAVDHGIYAAQILGLMGKSVLPDLVKVAQPDKQKHVLGRVVLAMQNIDEDEAVEALATILKNTQFDGEVRQWAATSLGKMKRKSAIPALQSVKNDSDSRVKEWSTWALKQLGVQE